MVLLVRVIRLANVLICLDFFMKTIFETERLLIRELAANDFAGFHEMHSNPNHTSA